MLIQLTRLSVKGGLPQIHSIDGRNPKRSLGVVMSTQQLMEVNMPILLLAGIPILLLGGGFVVYRVIGG